VDGLPKTFNFFAAYQGCRELGIETKPFCTLEDLFDWRQDELIVGGLGSVLPKLSEFGVEPPELDYPDSLRAYLGRKVWATTLDQVLCNKELRPVFVKPVSDKLFTGFILNTERDLPKLSNCTPHEPVLCSEVVSFLTEWRVFVRYGKILDVRPYYGDWHVQFQPNVIENAVNDYIDAPAGYAMDFGVTKNGNTLLVEVNDGFSLGSYGLDPIAYVRLLSARWSELIGIADECDNDHVGTEWKNHKRNNLE
jgi:hypothetical protein